MLYCGNCFKEKDKCTQIKGTIICQNCSFSSEIKKALHHYSKCYECNSPIYDSDSKHEFDKNISVVEYPFITSETEKIIRCSRCYNKKKKREERLRKNRKILF